MYFENENKKIDQKALGFLFDKYCGLPTVSETKKINILKNEKLDDEYKKIYPTDEKYQKMIDDQFIGEEPVFFVNFSWQSKKYKQNGKDLVTIVY